MTARALGPGPHPRRRALFGLLDAEGWGWASVKAFFWFVVIIFILGYIPDRAYYLTVNRAVDLGILAWSPINMCPSENQTLPCPAPVGAILPWEKNPEPLALPAPRTDGAVVQVGTKLLYIGGSDGTAPSDDVFVATTVPVGNFDRWTDGPPLPEPRSDAAVASFNGLVYVSGGTGPDGEATTTTFVLTPNLQTGELGEWQTAEAAEQPLDLPEARTGASLVALGDGLLLVGGAGPDGAPSGATWKSELDRQGKFGEWTPQAPLFEPVAEAIVVLNGDFVWAYGGRNTTGPTATVQRGEISTEEGDQLGNLTQWGVGPGAPNLPEPRVDAAGWASNGAIYLAGGADADGTENEVYWAVPAAGKAGDAIPEWKHLSQIDLPEAGVAGAAAATSGPNVFLVGGRSGDAVQTGAARSNLSPTEPFFQLGLVGATVPGLQLKGEIGQQLGQLNAAGVGTVNFIILIVIGVAFAHKDATRAFLSRRFGRDRKRR